MLVERILRLTNQPGHIRAIRQDRRAGDAAVGLMQSALRFLAGEVVALRAEGGVGLEHTGVPGVQNVRRADSPGGDGLIGGGSSPGISVPPSRWPCCGRPSWCQNR